MSTFSTTLCRDTGQNEFARSKGDFLKGKIYKKEKKVLTPFFPTSAEPFFLSLRGGGKKRGRERGPKILPPYPQKFGFVWKKTYPPTLQKQ